MTTFWGLSALGQDAASGLDPVPAAEASAAAVAAEAEAGAATDGEPAAEAATTEEAATVVQANPKAEEPSDLSVILTKLEESMPKPAVEETDDRFPDVKTLDTSVKKAYCSTCGGGGPRFGGSCSSCGASSGRCIPGRKNCAAPCPDTLYGRIFGNLYECLCCPDPCYQPSWIPAANASFFTDYARTRTITRLRWDHGWNMQFPDRSEYFWARQNLDTSKLMTARGVAVNTHLARPGGKPFGNLLTGGTGPKFPTNGYAHRGIFGQTGLDWDQMYLYQEAAAGRGSMFIEMPYRSYTTDFDNHGAGFGDLNFGTKAMLVDCEMLQVTFQFKTYTPTGQASKGFGTGHFSLEPSLLMALRLAEDTYFQGQLAEWIPLGGNSEYAGAVIRYSGSLNKVLFRTSPDSPVIGTLEGFGMTFQDGAYTDPFRGPLSSSGGTYFSIGPGLRHSLCDRVDYGGSVAWAVTDAGQWASPLLRLEMRILY
jgi:hypothetical protein